MYIKVHYSCFARDGRAWKVDGSAQALVAGPHLAIATVQVHLRDIN